MGGIAELDAAKSTFLVTGNPGIGKTTIIRQVVSTMRMRAAGFYTEDLRASGRRDGFRIVTLDGETALLAAAGHPGPVRVSKYGIDIEGLERVGVHALKVGRERGYVLVVDEIGRMQLFSREFRQLILSAIRDGHPILGTIMQGRNKYADRIRELHQVQTLTLTDENRGEILRFLRDRFL